MSKPIAKESAVLSAMMQRLHYAREVTAWRANTGGARPEDTRTMDALLGMLARNESPAKVIAHLEQYARRRGQKGQFGPKGQSDIMGYFTEHSRHVPCGTIFALEAKRNDGKPAVNKLSEDQLGFLTGIDKAGGVAACLDDVAHLDAVLSGSHKDPYLNEPPF